MVEVYTGTKAGRPTLLLLLSAGVLVAALGLAWFQVRGARALAGKVRIEGSPLVVRPPAGWIRDRDDSNMFVKTIAVGRQGRKRAVIERSIKFDYKRWKVFQPLPFLLRVSNWLDDKQAYEPELGRIGSFNGVQVRRKRVFQWRGRQELGESIYRLVSTARGDQISVEYTPLGELAPGDLELFDAVCRAVAVDDAGLNMRPEGVLERTGMQFPIEENWTIIGPDFPDVLGLYVQSNDGDGIPVWGLGLFRTWLAPGRRPADLLRSLVELDWPPELAAMVEPEESTRADGALIATVNRPTSDGADARLVAAWVLAESSSAAAMILVLADQRAAPTANQAAARLVEELAFSASYPPDGVEAADKRGRELVSLLRERGPAPWWGDGESSQYYFGELAGEIFGQILDQPVLVQSKREAVPGDSARGYEGSDFYLFAEPSGDQRRRWTIDAHAREYTYSKEISPPHGNRPPVVRMRESREAGDSMIQRTVMLEARRRRRFEIPVGPAFVPPPIQTLAQGWIAQQGSGTWLIEVSALAGSTTTTQLVTSLGPDDDGQRRVLLVDDYWPRGMILTFDTDLEMVSETAPVGRFDRVTPEQARRILRAMNR